MSVRVVVAAVVLLIGGLATPSARADIYQYTDADGVVHFTNSRPRHGKHPWKKVMKTDPAYGKAAARRGNCERCDIVP